MPVTGHVVVLNGSSSSGKSTLAAAFHANRAEAGECWLSTGIDDFIARLHPEWVGFPGHDGRYRADGFRLEPDGDRLEVRGGIVWEQLMRAYHRTVAAWATAGFDVVVDEVVFSAAARADWADALHGIPTTWVAVRCDLHTAMARELARGDRHIGLARAQAGVGHDAGHYDLVVDTTNASLGELVDQLRAVVPARRP